MFAVCRKFNSLDSLGNPTIWYVLYSDIIFNDIDKAHAHLERVKNWYPALDLVVYELTVI